MHGLPDFESIEVTLQRMTKKSEIIGLILSITAAVALGIMIIRVHAVGGATGSRATVCGTTVSARSAVHLRGAPVFLTLGHAYAGQDLTVVVLGKKRARFAAPEALIGQPICVSGRMIRFLGKPRLVLDSASR